MLKAFWNCCSVFAQFSLHNIETLFVEKLKCSSSSPLYPDRVDYVKAKYIFFFRLQAESLKWKQFLETE